MVSVSCDDEIFELEESVAVQSQKIKFMIDNKCFDTYISLPDYLITSEVLAKVIEYCKQHAEATDIEKLKEFDANFVEVDPDTLYRLHTAANYLIIKSLLDLTCHKITEIIKKEDIIDEAHETLQIMGDLLLILGEEVEFFEQHQEQLRKKYPVMRGTDFKQTWDMRRNIIRINLNRLQIREANFLGERVGDLPDVETMRQKVVDVIKRENTLQEIYKSFMIKRDVFEMRRILIHILRREELFLDDMHGSSLFELSESFQIGRDDFLSQVKRGLVILLKRELGFL